MTSLDSADKLKPLCRPHAAIQCVGKQSYIEGLDLCSIEWAYIMRRPADGAWLAILYSPVRRTVCGRSHTHSTYLRFRKEVNENQETLFPGHHSAKPCCCRSTGLHAEEGSTLCLYVCIGLHKSVRLYIASIYRSTSARKTAFVWQPMTLWW